LGGEMKIIGTDNYDRDYISDKLIAENVSEFWAKRIVEFMNEKYCDDTFYKVVEDDQELFIYEP